MLGIHGIVNQNADQQEGMDDGLALALASLWVDPTEDVAAVHKSRFVVIPRFTRDMARRAAQRPAAPTGASPPQETTTTGAPPRPWPPPREGARAAITIGPTHR